MIATVLEVGETGLETISPGAWLGEEGADMLIVGTDYKSPEGSKKQQAAKSSTEKSKK